jgi:hypothetical protein
MDPQLIEALGRLSPWAFGAILLFLSRKEILATIESLRADSRIGDILPLLSEMRGQFAEMNRQFAANMEMFHTTNGHMAAMHELLSQSLKVQTDMLTAMIRGQK